jgi:hypothetical protein
MQLMKFDLIINWAQSLARPGGNLTGLFLDLPELVVIFWLKQ